MKILGVRNNGIWLYNYWRDWAEIFSEDSPKYPSYASKLHSAIRPAVDCSTRKSTSDTTIFTIIALLGRGGGRFPNSALIPNDNSNSSKKK